MKRHILALFAICYAKSAFANAGYEEGMKAYQARNYSEAVTFFYPVTLNSAGDLKNKAEFGLAESLKALLLTHSAANFYLQILNQGPQHSFFRQALEGLSQINLEFPLEKSSLEKLFTTKVDPLNVPPAARAFYFFNRGLGFFEKSNLAAASAEFQRVPNNNEYYAKAQYYLGTILAIQGKSLDEALAAFQRTIKETKKASLRNLAILNIARVYYQLKNYKDSLQYYSQIPRNSEQWLEAIFESSWSFFMMQRHNNTLGNIHTIHSPFFSNRFFPESYILVAISYLKLCRYEELKTTLKKFQDRYRPTFTDLNSLLKKYQNQNVSFFNALVQYKNQQKNNEFSAAGEIVESLIRTEIFREALALGNRVEREKSILQRYSAKWSAIGLTETLRGALDRQKQLAFEDTGRELFNQTISSYKYLQDLSNQTRLINLEMLSGKTNELRAQYNQDTVLNDGTQWGEGMKPLDLKKELEYWPFEGEYWKDELGGYVYNISSICQKSAKTDEKPKAEETK